MDLAFKEMIRDQDEDFLKESPERPRSVSYFKAYQPTRQKTNPMAVWDAIHRQSQPDVSPEKLSHIMQQQRKRLEQESIDSAYFQSVANHQNSGNLAMAGRHLAEQYKLDKMHVELFEKQQQEYHQYQQVLYHQQQTQQLSPAIAIKENYRNFNNLEPMTNFQGRKDFVETAPNTRNYYSYDDSGYDGISTNPGSPENHSHNSQSSTESHSIELDDLVRYCEAMNLQSKDNFPITGNDVFVPPFPTDNNDVTLSDPYKAGINKDYFQVGGVTSSGFSPTKPKTNSDNYNASWETGSDPSGFRLGYTNNNKLPKPCSTKLFLGGVPWDITETSLMQSFEKYGITSVVFPDTARDDCNRSPSRIARGGQAKAGFVYIILASEKNVHDLLEASRLDMETSKFYFKLSSKRMRSKDVELIPWFSDDTCWKSSTCSEYRNDPRKTVFVGALHGMMTAELIAKMMTEKFGYVLYVFIDTDKHKYPIGSGRVCFETNASYLKAVETEFLQVKTPKFKKRIQIDPFLESQHKCQFDGGCKNLYTVFCRDRTCFKYYCDSCWKIHHSRPATSKHRPVTKLSKNGNM